MITIFTPSFADEADTNAQNLSVKEIVARLDPARFSVTMLHEGAVDPRISSRPNTRLWKWRKHGNTWRTLLQLSGNVPEIYFFPREGPLDAGFLKLRSYLRLKTALITYVVSGGLYLQPYSPARTNNIRRADRVVANNTYLTQLLEEKMGVEAATIYDGIDRRYFFPPESIRAGEKLVVLFAGSLRPYKRATLLVHQAARHPEVQFRIAGVGEEELLCRNLMRELGCANVQFLGHLTPAQVGEEMRRADIFFFPSVIEGHPQVLLQAAASGLPAIAMNVYRPDYIVNGRTGYLVENDEALGEKLDCLIREPQLRRTFGENALAHAQQFNWDAIVKQWQVAFEHTLERRQA
jgi:glycosyltransferase involved in cell wall biosynthesis